MDDLISRKEILKTINDLDLPDVHAALPVSLMLGVVKKALEPVPSVEAVPLEPLCQWLAAYAAPPMYALNAVAGDPIAPTSCGYPVNSHVEAWKHHFRELLKSGLMDMEEKDGENK